MERLPVGEVPSRDQRGSVNVGHGGGHTRLTYLLTYWLTEVVTCSSFTVFPLSLPNLPCLNPSEGSPPYCNTRTGTFSHSILSKGHLPCLRRCRTSVRPISHVRPSYSTPGYSTGSGKFKTTRGTGTRVTGGCSVTRSKT